MSVYRRLARSKKGMSTIFASLFMVILILMGFNLMLWNFIQLDAYNTVISSINQRDQQAISENLVVNNPGFKNLGGNTFNITVSNQGGVIVSVARIYITNILPLFSTSPCTSQCVVDLNPALCTLDGALGDCSFTNGNVPVGVSDQRIALTGSTAKWQALAQELSNRQSGYKIVLASTRGRLSSFFYPWPVPPPNNGAGQFQTNIGPLTIFFDFKSFNFTMGSQTVSQTAWVSPTSTSMVFWLKVTNAATDSDVTLREMSSMLFEPYSAGGVGAYQVFFISSPGSGIVNPSNVAPYNWQTNPYILPAQTVGGPSVTKTIFFGSNGQAGGCCVNFPTTEKTWVVFIGFYYMFKGNLQGQTIPFVAMKTCSAYPAASCY